MKSRATYHFTMVILSLWSMSLPLEADAELLIYEGFGYGSGNPLSGANGGTGWSNAWHDGSHSIQAPGLTYAGIPVTGNAVGGGGSAYRSFAADLPSAPGTTIWASALVNQDAPDLANFGFFNDGAALVSFGDTWTGSGASPNYSMYLEGNLVGSSTYVDSGVAIKTGTQLLAARIDIQATGTDIYLYLNPVVGSTAPAIADAIAAFHSSHVLVIDEARIEISNDTMDELRVATTYGEAVGQTVVPEPSSLISFVIALGGVGCVRWRRRS
jgi:hypothetical protein